MREKREGPPERDDAERRLGRLPWQRPLVGRDQELAYLRQLLLDTRCAGQQEARGQESGHAHPWPVLERLPGVLLLGEAGIGKTRLAEELSREAQTHGWSVIWSRSHTQESHIPYYAWSEVMRNAWRQDLWPIDEGQTRAEFLPLAALVPELIASPSGHLPASADGQDATRLWPAILAFVRALSVHAPLLIVLDDLQWADESSIKLFAYLLRRLANVGILLLATCRETELTREHPLRLLIDTLLHERGIALLRLPRLANEQIRVLLADLPEPQAKHIQQRAAGNPLFAEELARLLAGCAFSTPRQALPQTIAGVLDRRINGLSAACQTFLNHAAVLGEALSLPVLHALMSSGRQTQDEEHLSALIEEALQAGVLIEEGEGGQEVYYFWHPLLQSRLYERMSGARRARIHLRAAEILRQFYAGREVEGAALITHHLICAGADAATIVRYARLAGDRAYSLSAYPDAERYYRVVLDEQKRRSPDPHSLAAEVLDDLAIVIERVGECARNQGKFAEARAFYEQALRLYQERREGDGGTPSPQEVQTQALLWCEIGVTWYDMCNNERARECYSQSEQVLDEAGLYAGPARAYLRLQQSYLCCRFASRYEEARRYAEEALRLFQAVNIEEGRKHENEIGGGATRIRRILAAEPINLGRVQALLGTIACSSGRMTEALEYLKAALTLYEEHGYQREISIVCCNLGDLYLRRADHVLAHICLQRSLQIAEHVGDLPSVAVAAGNLGLLALHSGQLVEAEQWLRRSVAQCEYLDEPFYGCLFRAYLAISLLDQGRESEARGVLCRALKQARTSRTIIPAQSQALVTLGALHLAQAAVCEMESDDLLAEDRTRMLKLAQRILRRALAVPAMEVETRIEGQLLLAQALLQQGAVQEAEEYVKEALTELERCQLLWLFPWALRVSGCIYARYGLFARACHYFERSLQAARRHDLRLEQARTARHYAALLLSQGEGYLDPLDEQRGRDYLQEALRIFTACHARREVELVRRLLPVDMPIENAQTA